MLSHAEPHLERNIHPTVICRAFMKALDGAVAEVERLAFKIDFMDRDALLKVVDSCIATKFTRRFGTLIPVLFSQALRLQCNKISFHSDACHPPTLHMSNLSQHHKRTTQNISAQHVSYSQMQQ